MARLILATAEGQQAIELRPINSLGRHPNNTIQLLDKIVSKEHCILEQRDGQFILRDLGSLNGTYVNGERVRGEIAAQARRRDRARLDARPLRRRLRASRCRCRRSARARCSTRLGDARPPGRRSRRRQLRARQPPAPAHAPRRLPSASMPPQTSRRRRSRQHRARRSRRVSAAARVRAPPSFGGTRVDVLDAARAIGTQIARADQGLPPVRRGRPRRAAAARSTTSACASRWELTRDIGLERDLDSCSTRSSSRSSSSPRPTAASSCSARTTARCIRAPRAGATEATRRSRSARRS